MPTVASRSVRVQQAGCRWTLQCPELRLDSGVTQHMGCSWVPGAPWDDTPLKPPFISTIRAQSVERELPQVRGGEASLSPRRMGSAGEAERLLSSPQPVSPDPPAVGLARAPGRHFWAHCPGGHDSVLVPSDSCWGLSAAFASVNPSSLPPGVSSEGVWGWCSVAAWQITTDSALHLQGSGHSLAGSLRGVSPGCRVF